MKSYILMEKGYEYDDNYYNPVDGGIPKKVFFDIKDAEAEHLKLEIKNFKNTDITSYMYDIEDYLNVSKEVFENYINSLNEKYGKPNKKAWESGEFQLNESATEEEAKKYFDMISLRFFEISEVEVDIPSLRNHQIEQILPS